MNTNSKLIISVLVDEEGTVITESSPAQKCRWNYTPTDEDIVQQSIISNRSIKDALTFLDQFKEAFFDRANEPLLPDDWESYKQFVINELHEVINHSQHIEAIAYHDGGVLYVTFVVDHTN